MSGTINLALTQQFDMDGVPLSGGLLQFFTAGTTTPQTPFQDTALTIAHPNPIVLDASGRVPMFYLADGFIKISLKDKNGVVVIAADQLLVIGPSSGGGGGGSVDPNTVLQTGDIKARYGTGVLTGFVRCNGNTIGTTGSSATELAGLTAQALYEYLWAFPNIALDSAVKGASAIADFGALKRLILPDLRGRVIAGLDDMGATAASRLTSTYFGASGIVLGSAGGAENVTLGAGNLPVHMHTQTGTFTGIGATTSTPGNHSHGGGSLATNPTVSGTIAVAPAGGSTTVGVQSGANFSVYPTTSFGALAVGAPWGGATDLAGDHGHNVSVSTTISGSTGNGSGTFLSTPTRTVPPAMVMTIYMKL